MRKTIMFLAIGAMAFVAGCNSGGNKSAGIPVGPKWKGPAYRLAFNTKNVKKNPTGVTIPPITFTANPDALETRAVLIVRFDPSQAKTDRLIINQAVLSPFNISGSKGSLSADTMKTASDDMTQLLSVYCMPNKVKVSAALARSSINMRPDDAEIQQKRLSDWITTELPYKNLRKGCPEK